MIHLFAVDKALEALKPPMEKDKLAEHLLPWLNDLRLSRNAIDTILSLPPYNAVLENARLYVPLSHVRSSSEHCGMCCFHRVKWQLIQALQMYLEHVLLRHSEVPVSFARRLELVCQIFQVTVLVSAN